MAEQKKGIAILGSTGSIGKQALEVIEALPGSFAVEVLTAGSNADLLIEQAKKHRPNCVVICDKSAYQRVNDELFPLDIKVYAGEEALEQVVQMETIDLVLTALVGYAGLRPTISAIRAKKHIALANKETLVVAGELITEEADRNKVLLLPVDSEHSAIFQCLPGEHYNPIEKIYLTASGGPFRGYNRQALEGVTREQALKHPNWDMGAKITIDSATMMNKGLEVIEARWLFDLDMDQIDVVVHPQSIIHSIVQFQDGSMKAQMGLPDMKVPIQYALTYPLRKPNSFERFNFLDYPQLTFEKADTGTFRCLQLAFESLKRGGNAPCVLNAANEIAVQSFLEDRIGFLDIPDVIEKALDGVSHTKTPSLEDYEAYDKEARRKAEEACRMLTV